MSFWASSILAQADNGIFSFLHTMEGPEFLGLYLVWFAVVFVTVLILRWRGRDSPVTTVVGVACFELLGVARMIVGSAHGLHQWEFLIVMMILGGLAFFYGPSISIARAEAGGSVVPVAVAAAVAAVEVAAAAVAEVDDDWYWLSQGTVVLD